MDTDRIANVLADLDRWIAALCDDHGMTWTRSITVPDGSDFTDAFTAAESQRTDALTPEYTEALETAVAAVDLLLAARQPDGPYAVSMTGYESRGVQDGHPITNIGINITISGQLMDLPAAEPPE